MIDVSTPGVHCTRGEVVESVHRVHAAVVDWNGRLIRRHGDPDRVTFYRSAVKPIQALPLVEDGVADAYGLNDDELALCCASHNSGHRHLTAARSILKKAGCREEDLRCGPHLPLNADNAEALLRAGVTPGPIHNNCSGKHAGMLALAAFHGWPVQGYLDPEHPVQQRMRAEVSRWSEIPEAEIPTAIDGCGVPTFALSLRAMAYSFARFTAAAREGEGPARIVRAMVRSPYMVAGEKRLCTKLMWVAGDRVFAKTGAEGLYCAGVIDGAVGVAVKVEDGARRGSDAALVRVLEALGALSADQVEELSEFGRPPVKNTLDQEVGRLHARFDLEAPESVDPMESS